MKGLMAKFKGAKFKELLIGHAEKLVLGVVGLVVLLALYSTNWTGETRSPEKLYADAEAAYSKLNTGEMPAEKLKEFTPSTYQMTAMNMFTPLNNPEGFSQYSFGPPMSFPLHPRQKPHEEVKWPVVQYMLANASHMVRAEPIPFDETAGEDASVNGVDDRLNAKNKANTKANLSAPKAAKGREKDLDDPALMAAQMMGGMSADGMGSGIKAKGQRFVSVVGIVNLIDTAKAIQKAKNLQSWQQEAMSYIEVRDFKVQRQKAVAGDNPWPEDTWEDVDMKLVDEILAEGNFMADIVDSGVTDPVYTMPLPARLDGDYTEIVSHPLLKGFELSEEDRKMEKQLQMALMGWANEKGIEENKGKRNGYLGQVYDINSLKSQYMNSEGDAKSLMDRAKIKGTPNLRSYNMGPGMGGGRGGPAGMPGYMGGGARGGAPGMGAGMPGVGGRGMPMMGGGMPGGAGYGKAPSYPGGRGGAMPPMGNPMTGSASYGKAPANYPGGGRGGAGGMPGYMGGPAGMGMNGMNGMNGQMQEAIGANAVGYWMLFRFLDFGVNPGEVYRYRVQLEFANPNAMETLDHVKEAKVLEGETRLTDFSEPTAPVYVRPDSSFYLARVENKRARSRGEAEFQMVQWEPTLGTLIDTKKLVAKFGQFVGGLQESDQLDLGTQTLEKRQMLFSSKDFLLDTMAAPALVPVENPDLNLPVEGKGKGKDPIDLPSEAIVLDENGQTRRLDSMSDRQKATDAETAVKTERDQYEYLRPTEEEETTDAADPFTKGKGKGGKAGAKDDAMMQQMSLTSGLKRGRGGKNGAGSYGGAPGYPGGGRGGKAGAAPSGYGTAPGYPGGRGGRGGRGK